MNLSNVRVATKLWATIFGLLIIMALVNLWVQKSTMATMEKSREDVQRIEKKIALAEAMRGKILRSIEMGIAMQSTSEERLQQAFQARFKDLYKVAHDALTIEMPNALRTQADKDAFQVVLNAFDDLKNSRERALKNVDQSDGDARADYALGEYVHYAEIYGGKIGEFIELQRAQSSEMMQAANAARDQANWMGWISTCALMLLGVILARWLVLNINKPLQDAVALTEAIGAGNLTVKVQTDRKDELGQLLNALSHMADRLRSVIGEVRQGVDAVSSAAGQIASGNQDLSARTEQTAANLQQTAASVEEMSATANQAADTSRQANQLAATAVQAAERGGDVVQQVVNSMEQINSSSRKISDIIGVIDGIAFQTNILALNAAVEAARAGEQGRGFAVVAGEVRTLAQRSAEAAKEIKGLIEASVNNVEIGASQVQQAGASMDEIVSSVRRVTDLIGELTASASEQSTGFSQVNLAVSNLDQMTQQNAALVEESSAAANAMHDQANLLMQAVSIFDVGTHNALAPAAVKLVSKPAAIKASNTFKRVEPVVAPEAAAAKSAPATVKPAARKTSAQAKPRALSQPAAPAASSDDDWETF